MQTPLPAKNRRSGCQFSLFLKILSLSFRIFSLFIVVSVVFSVLAIRRISQPAITALNIAMSPPIIRRLISIFPWGLSLGIQKGKKNQSKKTAR